MFVQNHLSTSLLMVLKGHIDISLADCHEAHGAHGDVCNARLVQMNVNNLPNAVWTQRQKLLELT